MRGPRIEGRDLLDLRIVEQQPEGPDAGYDIQDSAAGGAKFRQHGQHASGRAPAVVADGGADEHAGLLDLEDRVQATAANDLGVPPCRGTEREVRGHPQEGATRSQYDGSESQGFAPESSVA